MASFVGKEDIPDHWLCPVCLEVPEKEVYQCRDGHLLCNICYFQVTDAVCPQCRKPLDRDDPIRNRMMEEVFDGFKVNCQFKPSGCDKRLSKKSVEKHEIVCSFDLNKFGEFVIICEKIGFPGCDFKCNNGNAKETVEHLLSKHGCILTTSERFQMELKSFKESAKAGRNGFHFWTPIIADLKERKCYLLTMVVLNKVDASFTWLSMFLPYPTNEHPENSPVKMKYRVKTGTELQFPVLTEIPISLKEAHKMLPNKIDFVYNSLSIAGRCSKEGNLLIDCNMKNQGVTVQAAKENMQNFVCTRNTHSLSVVDIHSPNAKVFVRFDRLKEDEGSSPTKSFRDKLEKDCSSNRSNLLPLMINLLEGENPADLPKWDVEWLKTELIFLASEYGGVEALKYLIGKGVSFNIVDEFGRSPLHYTMWDSDVKIGMEKAKLLVDSALTDVHVLDDLNWSVLHYAALFGNQGGLEYFIWKGCDVNAKQVDGSTPLHCAALSINEEKGLKIAKSLVANEADLSIKDGCGDSALNVATNKGKYKILQLLRSHQSNNN